MGNAKGSEVVAVSYRRTGWPARVSSRTAGERKKARSGPGLESGVDRFDDLPRLEAALSRKESLALADRLPLPGGRRACRADSNTDGRLFPVTAQTPDFYDWMTRQEAAGAPTVSES